MERVGYQQEELVAQSLDEGTLTLFRVEGRLDELGEVIRTLHEGGITDSRSDRHGTHGDRSQGELVSILLHELSLSLPQTELIHSLQGVDHDLHWGGQGVKPPVTPGGTIGHLDGVGFRQRTIHTGLLLLVILIGTITLDTPLGIQREDT